jgi:PAS domain S-box-containing protein
VAQPADDENMSRMAVLGKREPQLAANRRTTTKYMVELAVVGLVYFALAKLGLLLASIHPSATPIWPPTGFALAVLLLRGYRIAPAIFAGALLANATTAGTVYSSAGIALGNTLEGLVGAYFVNRWCGGCRAFESPTRVVRFALVCLAIATPISPTLGIGSLSIAGYVDFSRVDYVWMTWWLGDLAGALVVAPVVILWATARATGVGRQQLLEGAAVLAGACLVGTLTFSPLIQQSSYRDPFAFFLIAPLLWAALRLDQRATATIALVFSCFAVMGTLLGTGPFARPTLNESFLLLVMFVISTALPSLALSADAAVRRRTESQLREAHADLSRQIQIGSASLAETERALHQARVIEGALRESDGRLRLALGIAELGTWEYDIARDVATWSPAIAEIFGLPGRDHVTRAEWSARIHPDDRPRVISAFSHALQSGAEYNPEYRVVRPDGAERWLACRTAVLRDEHGKPQKLMGVGQDITDQKAVSERQQLLIAELDHRVRNILTAAQSMLVLTARSATTKEELVTTLRGRIGAMARAHGLLTREHWTGIDLRDLLSDALQPYGEAVVLNGERGCILRAKDAVDLALALHELATNAAKHGALSSPDGRVELTWRVVEGERARVRIDWQESGGPQAALPTRRGFGLQLIENVLPGVELSFEPAGLRCTLELELRTHQTQSKAAIPDLESEQVGKSPRQPDKPLQGQRVLIVEDEVLAMLDMRSALEAAGADILGMARTLDEARELVNCHASLAVLDVNLRGELSFPIAEQLVARGVPVLFATGYDIASLAPAHLKKVPTLQKPFEGAVLVQKLIELAQKGRAGAD